MIGEGTMEAIREEALRQDAKWGITDHEPEWWMVILMEEVGELAQAVLAFRFGKDKHSSHSQDMRTEAVQIAACAAQFLECLDRNEEVE
jgi:NTP pyrophosphatase (non-canonical NTP hydrolase)